MKVCKQCKKSKPLSEFSKHSQSKDGLRYDCKSCSNAKSKERYALQEVKIKANLAARKSYAKRIYGLTLEEHEAYLAKPCSICGKHKDRMNLDHCHKTGQIRDTLCSSCNRGIGFFFDDPTLLQSAITYLNRFLS